MEHERVAVDVLEYRLDASPRLLRGRLYELHSALLQDLIGRSYVVRPEYDVREGPYPVLLPRRREQNDIGLRAGRLELHPAHSLAELLVVDHLKAQDVYIKPLCTVLVGDRDANQLYLRDHGPTSF